MKDELVRYFTPTPADSAPLRAMARQSFSETFAHLYPPRDLEAFLDEAYGTGGRMERHLADPTISWLVAASDGQPVGYAKVMSLVAPAPAPLPGALELQQIYVLRLWQGKGIADHLMGWALSTAREQGAPEIYLTVFDHNERAKHFYTRYGFTDVGYCTFTIADRVYDDRIWRKPL